MPKYPVRGGIEAHSSLGNPMTEFLWYMQMTPYRGYICSCQINGVTELASPGAPTLDDNTPVRGCID